MTNFLLANIVKLFMVNYIVVLFLFIGFLRKNNSIEWFSGLFLFRHCDLVDCVRGSFTRHTFSIEIFLIVVYQLVHFTL